MFGGKITMGDEEEKATLTAALIERENAGTVPVDPRFPNTNQVRSRVVSPRQLECGAPQLAVRPVPPAPPRPTPFLTPRPSHAHHQASSRAAR